MQIITTKSDKRWVVKFKEDNRWQLGLYKPEFRKADEVKQLEKHNYPELFYLLSGEIILLLSEDGKNIHEVKMERDKIYIVTEWHNAYSPNGDGIALVIERPDIETEYISI